MPTKDQLRVKLHNLNPYAGYTGDYGRRLTKEQLIRTLERYEQLNNHEYDKLEARPNRQAR